MQKPVSSSPASQTPQHARLVTSKSLTTKKKLPQNQSILNFFGKAEPRPSDGKALEERLFFEDAIGKSTLSPSPSSAGFLRSAVSIGIARDDSDDLRYNEDRTPSKRRRLSQDTQDLLIRTPSPERRPTIVAETTLSKSNRVEKRTSRTCKQRGPFEEESSDEDSETASLVERLGHQQPENSTSANSVDGKSQSVQAYLGDDSGNDSVREVVTISKVPLKPPGDLHPAEKVATEQGQAVAPNVVVPPLNHQQTSGFDAVDFDADDDFQDDEFAEEGEEYMNRRWMEEQRELEMGFDEDSKSESGYDSARTPASHYGDEQFPQTTEAVAICPICNGSMKDLSDLDASSHVNACLDGKAPLLPKIEDTSCSDGTTAMSVNAPSLFRSESMARASATKRFQRAAVARPAQANPFTATKDSKFHSAFSKLMSGHAEDAAWSEAATNELQSRGKPAYQRTCPFYKIMPGFYICVDAFRYGKVEGQNAYFLSHFHSDHYIGLTSSWCHGPIYASRVTCNLMKQQLRVDPKWIVPLEFEQKVEVPGTKGVSVTMIPANHCPGSSLYLFEKVIGKNKDGSPKLTRLLHCGDFRACPAHVYHPLLRPDVLDSITGQTKQQIIDTCYLDTTYLTPKYAFPSQHDVIDACAQMCVSLAKEIVDHEDSWERVKLERAGSTMTKFLEQGEPNTLKIEEAGEDKKPKIRGRLLVVIGTYSIGKERICLGIAKALNSKIYAPPAKMRICACLEDDELNARLTKNPLEAQVHMQTLMEIRAETLHDYLVTYNGRFSRVVGFRPTGWSYRPPTSRFTENPAVNTVLHAETWKSRFTMRDLVPQRGSTRESNCFGVPYSEHSSFRELTMFCCALRINKVVPTVNVGSAKSREKMKGWIEKWDVEKRKNGLFKVEVGAEGWGSGDGKLRYGV